jgi:formate dehydrogenase iron-sulfur subunit
MPIQLARNIKYPGFYEMALAATMREDRGSTAARSAPVPRSMFDPLLGYEAVTEGDGLIGHAGIVVLESSVESGEAGALAPGVFLHRILRPCRVRSMRGVEVIDRDENGSTARRCSRPLPHHGCVISARCAIRRRE